jgi:hypothetical protein
MHRPGMPASSRVLTLPFVLYELKGEEHTQHQRKQCPRPAAKDKQRDLDVAHSLVAIDAIPKDGGHTKRGIEQPSLLGVAKALGLKWAESACRLIHRAGKSFIDVKGTKGRNKYNWDVPQKPESSRTYRKEFFQAASAREAVKNPEFAKYLPEEVNQLSEVNFVKYPEIAHHEHSPLTRTQRAVFDFLCESGLFVYDKSAKRWKSGSVKLTQEFIASKLGRHRDTVRKALCRLAAEWTDRRGAHHKGLGIIKFVRKPGAWMKHGKPVPKGTEGSIWQQDEPNEYIGICDWAETEKERYDRAMEPLRAAHYEWAAVMDSIFKQTRLEWLEEGRQVATFQRECWQRMSEVGVPDKILERIFPRPPN